MLRPLLSRLCLAAIRLFPLTRAYGVKRALLRMAGLTVGRNVRVVSSARFVTPFVELGDNTFVGHECLLIAAHGSRIRIGRNVDLAPRCSLITGSHEIGGPDQRAGRGFAKDIVIEDGVWAGTGVTVVAGVRVGAGAVLAAGSLVARDVKPHTLYGGNPARLIRRLDAEETSAPGASSDP